MKDNDMKTKTYQAILDLGYVDTTSDNRSRLGSYTFALDLKEGQYDLCEVYSITGKSGRVIRERGNSTELGVIGFLKFEEDYEKAFILILNNILKREKKFLKRILKDFNKTFDYIFSSNLDIPYLYILEKIYYNI